MKYDVIIIGAGFAGATLANKFAEDNKKVLLVDKRNHIGGNCYDCDDEYGILVIDEVPAVCMKWWEGYNFGEDRVDDQTKVLHKELIKQLL